MRLLTFLLFGALACTNFAYAEIAAQPPATEEPVGEVTPVAIEALAWLHLVDGEKYAESWNAGSTTLQMVMKEKEWVKYLEKIRKPLGSVISRSLVEQREAKDPPGVPAGNYRVMVYQTAFSTRPKASELMILSETSDGHWRTMSYFVK